MVSKNTNDVMIWKEKAIKYDNLMNANSEIVQGNIKITNIYQENKKLNEKMKMICDILVHAENKTLVSELWKVLKNE